MSLVLRAVGDREIGPAVEVFMASYADMTARYRMRPSKSHDYVAAAFAHLARTGIFRIAELDGRAVSICAAIVRGDQWFLSSYWTLPDFQGQGIGSRLIREVYEEGRRLGARLSFVWSSPDYAAIAAYLRLGMLPGFQLLAFSGKPSSLPKVEGVVESLDLRAITALDREVRGVEREIDHAFWRGYAPYRGYQVRAGERVVGYFYLNGAAIAPAAWAEGEASRVLGLALRAAAATGDEPRLVVPGANHDALKVALDSGLRLGSVSHLLWSEAFGRMDRYIPSGGLLF